MNATAKWQFVLVVAKNYCVLVQKHVKTKHITLPPKIMEVDGMGQIPSNTND